ncbi:DEAD/DEAH box helicase [Rhizobium ruizarguesonis]
MYDSDTANLIRLTPQLEGLDRDRLPEQLSEAFAKIAAARMKLRGGSDVDEDVVKLIGEMQRLALTNEALVASAPTRDDRASAAFVAGSAHQLCFNARSIRSDVAADSYLEARSISPDVAAMLLFLIAEATADATEIALRPINEESLPVERELLVALKAIARGELTTILSAEMPGRDVVIGDDANAATSALYYVILEGVRYLAAELLAEGAETGRAIEIFTKVQELSAPVVEKEGPAWLRGDLGSFSGPFHLASLLIATAADLADSAVTAVPPPGGISPETWLRAMKKLATARPYLWRNHREAIVKGYLEPDVSAAVSFPTGAGKSTLAELKINTTLLLDKKVVFLAPTNALVSQTTSALKRTFKGAKVGRDQVDQFGFGDVEDALPQILVMTPESCLAYMSVDPAVFEDVGLLVFDECHLLHADEEGRRALDAMLCVLNFGALVPSASFLFLSAMMKNTGEIAGWVEEMTGRSCLPLSLAWKPTRQLRGCVVYPQGDVTAFEKNLRKARIANKTRAPSVADKAGLVTTPYAFFGLKQTWSTRDTTDYSLVSLLSDDVNLSASAKTWLPTPNAGAVSSKIAAAAASSGIKTLIFFQTIPNAVATKNRFAEELGTRKVPLTEDEKKWFNTAVSELGGAGHSFLDVFNNELTSPAVVHHGLLLTEERNLCESLFKRDDGASIMAATPTVAQGMNFPSELVIIAEDSRFDADANRREVLEAQDLLNAAGRAGRAGQNANGIVLVIPGKVIGIDVENSTIGSHWSTLQKVFGQSDQCLVIDDPLTAILDRIHSGVTGSDELQRYAIARLSTGGVEPSLKKSLAAYRARQRGDEKWFEERLDSAIEFHGTQAPETEGEVTVHQVSSMLGIPLQVVQRLSTDLTPEALASNGSVKDWRIWLFDWIEKNSDLFDQIFRKSTLDEFFDTRFAELEDSNARAAKALPVLRELTRLWMRGATLRKLQLALGTKENKLNTCLDARRFALRIVPELAYLFGLPALLLQRHRIADGQEPSDLPAAISRLGTCVRFGYRSADVAALASRQPSLSRREVRKRLERLLPYLAKRNDSETWSQTQSRVETAVIAQLMASRSM